MSTSAGNGPDALGLGTIRDSSVVHRVRSTHVPHVFADGELVTVDEFIAQGEDARLELRDGESLGTSYALTLRTGSPASKPTVRLQLMPPTIPPTGSGASTWPVPLSPSTQPPYPSISSSFTPPTDHGRSGESSAGYQRSVTETQNVINVPGGSSRTSLRADRLRPLERLLSPQSPGAGSALEAWLADSDTEG